MPIIDTAKSNFLVDGWIRWACPDSPSGCCVYDTDKDPAMDDCLYCHQPQERK